MTAVAAIDRIVHHCTILELGASSYRTEKTLTRGHKEEVSKGI
jgi:DNA replication protein DnaC